MCGNVNNTVGLGTSLSFQIAEGQAELICVEDDIEMWTDHFATHFPGQEVLQALIVRKATDAEVQLGTPRFRLPGGHVEIFGPRQVGGCLAEYLWKRGFSHSLLLM